MKDPCISKSPSRQALRFLQDRAPLEKPGDASAAVDFNDVANRATAYHAMQIRGKVTTNDDGSGSHGRGRTLWGT